MGNCRAGTEGSGCNVEKHHQSEGRCCTPCRVPQSHHRDISSKGGDSKPSPSNLYMSSRGGEAGLESTPGVKIPSVKFLEGIF